MFYGVGSRLDDNPELLFRLRGADEAELIATDMALPRGAPPADTLADGELGSVLGIELDAEDGVPSQKAKKARSTRAPKPEKTLRRYADPSPVVPEQERGDAAAASPFRPTGALIAELRERGGFSVAEFAELLQVSGTTVRRWEAASGPFALHARTQEALWALRLAIGEKQDD